MFIDFDSISNARDLGGIRCAGGRRVKSGALLRTAELDRVSAADMETLTRVYALRHVVDLRDASEIALRPDLAVAGARYTAIPVLPELPYKSRSVDLKPSEIMEQFVLLYRIMAEHEFCARAWSGFFRVLLAARGETVLWHCVQGKDRTGIAALLLLCALGASMEEAREDYFLTNAALGRDYERLEQSGADERELAFMKIVLYVFPECLDTFIRRAAELYGSLDGYLKKAVGLTGDDFELLRDSYTI